MLELYWNTFSLILGLVMGIGLAVLFEYFHISQKIQEEATYKKVPGEDLANRLYNETRILCMVLTMPQNHETKALEVKRTWGSRCNKLIFISSQEDKELGAINVHVLEKRRYQFRKVRKAIKYVNQNFVGDYDWFLKADDDTFVIMENLRLLLYPHDPEAALYFGHRYCSRSPQGNKSEGASYVMSREALRRFQRLPRNVNKLDSQSLLAEEQQLCLCMQHVGVVAGGSRDEEGHDQFVPVTLFDNLPKVPKSSDNQVADFGSKSGIIIHPVKNHDMMEFLLYKLLVFGVPDLPKSLPPKLGGRQVENQMKQMTNNYF